MNTYIDNRYQLIKKLGSGSYGIVYSATDKDTNKPVVVKLARDSLLREAEAYELLHRNWSPTGIPKIYAYVNNNVREYLVMQKLGKNISYYWKRCHQRFSLKTALMLGLQMISRLECVHNRGIVHGDIKDDNFVMDEQCQTLYIIDFGLARSFIDNFTGVHVFEGIDRSVMGTILYASINTHNKSILSWRDDIESLLYLVIRLLKGNLPWESRRFIGKTYEETFDNVGEKKERTDSYSLCLGLPEQIKQALNYARRLPFSEKPDYAYLKDLLRRALVGHNLNNDGVYDWMVSKAIDVSA